MQKQDERQDIVLKGFNEKRKNKTWQDTNSLSILTTVKKKKVKKNNNVYVT